MKKIKMIMLAFVLIFGASALNGCRTAHGFGEDMEHAGEKIQDGTNK